MVSPHRLFCPFPCFHFDCHLSPCIWTTSLTLKALRYGVRREPQSLERPHSLENDCAVANIEEARAHDSKSKDASEPISHNDKMRALAGISYDDFANLMTERRPSAPAPKFKVVHYYPRSSTLDDELSTISPFGCLGLVQHRFKQTFNSVSEDPCSRFRGRVLTCIDGISREDFFRWPSFLDRTYGAF